jgi:hypothetical protein
LQNVKGRIKNESKQNTINMTGITVTIDQLAEQDLYRLLGHIAYIKQKYSRYKQRINNKKHHDEFIEKIKQHRILHHNDSITTFVVDYVMLIIDANPPMVFTLSLDEALMLCKQYGINCTKTKCLNAMKAAAAGLGAKIVDSKVSFKETQLTITKQAA